MKIPSNSQRYYAFTLIELLIAISIVSILFGYGLPSFNQMLERKKVSINVERLVQTIQLSRHTAITKNTKVTLCPINNSLQCTSDWSNGYMSFVDIQGDREFNDNDTLLYQHFSQDEKSTLSWRAFGYRRSLQWLETGITNHQNGSFVFCYNNKSELSRGVYMTKSGRVRTSKDTNGDDIHERASGEPIIC